MQQPGQQSRGLWRLAAQTSDSLESELHSTCPVDAATIVGRVGTNLPDPPGETVRRPTRHPGVPFGMPLPKHRFGTQTGRVVPRRIHRGTELLHGRPVDRLGGIRIDTNPTTHTYRFGVTATTTTTVRFGLHLDGRDLVTDNPN